MQHPPAGLRHLLRLCLLAALAAGAMGCAPSTYDKLSYTFAGYQYADRDLVGGSLIRTLLDHEGSRPICVRTVAIITSHNIVGGEVVERADGTHAVRLALDRIGQDVWLQACHQLGGQRLAITIDGFFLFNMTIPHRPADYETILVEGPWEEAQARGVATRAAANFQILNPKTGM